MAFPSTYYRHAAQPRRYVYDWRGRPQQGSRAAETRALGGVPFVVRSSPGYRAYEIDYPVTMSAEHGRRSILHSGPEQTKIYDGEVPPELGFFGQMSENERRLALLGGIGLVGFLVWRYFK